MTIGQLQLSRLKMSQLAKRCRYLPQVSALSRGRFFSTSRLAASPEDFDGLLEQLEELREQAKLLTHKRFAAKFRKTVERIEFLENKLEAMGENAPEDAWLQSYKPPNVKRPNRQWWVRTHAWSKNMPINYKPKFRGWRLSKPTRKGGIPFKYRCHPAEDYASESRSWNDW